MDATLATLPAVPYHWRKSAVDGRRPWCHADRRMSARILGASVDIRHDRDANQLR